MGVRGCARVCAGVRECAQVCMGVCGYARVCAGMHGCALVCASVHGCAQMCASVCVDMHALWDEFSEFLLENRVPTSADFNTYPIRIFY